MDYLSIYSFEGPIEGYVINFLQKNYWRVKNYFDYEDAVQEARYTFTLLLRRMERNNSLIENAKHLMSLFKSAWTRHFHTLSNRDTKRIDFAISNYTTEDHDDWILDSINLDASSHNLGYLEVVIDQAPKEVRQVLNLLLTAPKEMLGMAVESWGNNNKRNSTITNEFLCRMLGYNHKEIDLIKNVRNYLLTDQTQV